MKFVILDEVDYMTKNAQQALRYLLQNYSNSVRFCLICNYISRIDEGLQNEFLRLRFNQLPTNDMVKFLGNISASEKLNLNEKSLYLIQKLYKSDIRSMINFMQSNQNIKDEDINIIDDIVWDSLYSKIKKGEALDLLIKMINEISNKFNMDKKNIIKDFLNYIIRNKSNISNHNFLNFVENLMHSQNLNNNNHIYYSLSRLSSFVSSVKTTSLES
jgi:DNA polymerase III delta prime subunit